MPTDLFFPVWQIQQKRGLFEIGFFTKNISDDILEEMCRPANLCPSAGMIRFRFKGYNLSPAKGTPKDIGCKGSIKTWLLSIA